MVNYQKEKVKLTNTQLNFEDEELSHELFATTRQSIKVCNAIANNTSTNIKLHKDQILKFSQESVTVL